MMSNTVMELHLGFLFGKLLLLWRRSFVAVIGLNLVIKELKNVLRQAR